MLFFNNWPMKKLFVVLLLAILSLVCAEKLFAQHNYGPVAGVTLSRNTLTDFSKGTLTQYHVGFTYRAKLPHGFSIQPSLLYQVKGSKGVFGGENTTLSVGYAELPVSIQWGPDLILFRPFLDLTPFVGYGIHNNFWSESTGKVNNSWDGLTRWEYGVGVGLGLDIWHFQVIARYNWNLGAIALDSSLSNIAQTFKDGSNFGGITLSVAYLF